MRGDAGLSDRVHALALEYVAPAADEVDRDARFPKESIEALRSERLLSALVPANLGAGERA